MKLPLPIRFLICFWLLGVLVDFLVLLAGSKPGEDTQFYLACLKCLIELGVTAFFFFPRPAFWYVLMVTYGLGALLRGVAILSWSLLTMGPWFKAAIVLNLTFSLLGLILIFMPASKDYFRKQN